MLVFECEHHLEGLYLSIPAYYLLFQVLYLLHLFLLYRLLFGFLHCRYFLFTLIDKHIRIFIFWIGRVIASKSLVCQIFNIKIRNNIIIELKPSISFIWRLQNSIIMATVRRSRMNDHTLELILKILM